MPIPIKELLNNIFCKFDVNSPNYVKTKKNIQHSEGNSQTSQIKEVFSELDLRVTTMTKNSLEFDLIGVDSSIANALRRIMIGEVPTIAIEHVFIVNNTSLIQDEVLAHRLGLLPIFADPTKFDFPLKNVQSNDKNTVIFSLEVSGHNLKNSLGYKKVYSSFLKWLPNGSEMPEITKCRFTKHQDISQVIRPAKLNILLAVLGPDQEIILEAHCKKGTGKEHAKWSPVGTSWYYFIPEAVMLQRAENEIAEELANQFPGFVKLIGKKPYRRAIIEEARLHQPLLEKVRRLSSEDKWSPFLQLRKVKEHFVFKVETSGVIPPKDVFNQAIVILIEKIEKLIKHVAVFDIN
jgi:DNA-directed RNA polymerase I and III subunit RPAC1